MSDAPHLFIGVPTIDGKLSVELHKYLSSLELLASHGRLPFSVSVGIVTGLSPVQYARNVLAKMALETPAGKVAMIDADMLPEPSVTRLFSHPSADIIVPRMFRFRHNGPDAEDERARERPPEIACCATIVRSDDDRIDLLPKYGDEGTYRVHAAGTGFIVMNRAVLEDPRMRVGPDEKGVPALFQMKYTSTGRITEWEDVDFTLRAHRLGYVVAADFGARCGHRKTVNLDAVAELMYLANPEKTEVLK